MEIIDGQQRLTTFQIILCAIRDVCKVFDNDTTNIEKTAQNRVLNDLTRLSRPSRSPESDQKYKLLPRAGSDQETFQRLVASEITEAKKKDQGGFIYGAYVYFKDEIEGYVTQDHHKLEILLDTLIETILKDFVMVQITVDSDDDPEKIFQTINGTGRALNDFDLLRNDLFLRAGTGTKREELYKKYWQQFDEYEFWRRKEGKVVDQFLLDFLKAKLGNRFANHQKLFDQYQEYCKELPEKPNLAEYENPVEYEFEQLSRYAQVYQKMHDMGLGSDLGYQMDFYKKFNNEFNLTPQLLRSFVLYITNELGMSGPERDRAFALLESYAVRWILCNSTGSAPVGKINSLFLDILDKRKSLNLLDLWHLLSNQFPDEKEVNSRLVKLFPSFNNTRRKKGKLSRVQKLGRYILDEIDIKIIKGPLSTFEVNKLHKCFCEIWPSSEVLLQSCLKGDLPIVYSQLSDSVETKPRLDPYNFVTYNGARELLEYEVQQGNWVGIDADSTSKEKVELPTEEILFTFPSTALSSLRFLLFLDPIQDDVKSQSLMSVPKEKSYQVKHWLRLYADTTEVSTSKHWILPDIDATVVTRAGHVLPGTLKSFNDNAIYMEIENQIVTVYMHGIYNLNTAEMLKSETYIFITYNGMRELSKHEMVGDTVVGTDTSITSNEQVLLDVEEILFAFPATSMSTLQVHLNNIRDDVKNQRLTSIPKHENPKFEHNQLTKQSEIKIVTRAGHVLQGTVKNVYKEAILVQIGQETVKVFWHGLHDLEVKSKRQRSGRGSGSGSKMPWQYKIESKKNQPISFMQGTGITKLSEITESTGSKITGIDENRDRIEIQTQDVLFAYYSARGKSSDVSRRKIWIKIEAPKTQQVEQSSIILKSVNQPNNKFSLKVVTLAGHVLQGLVKNHDNDAIYMEIGGRKVIVFRHGLSTISLITTGDSMLESEPFKFITYDGTIELSQIKTFPYELKGIDEGGNQLPPLKKLNILFAYPLKAALDVEPIEIETQVEEQKLEPIQQGRFVKNTLLDSAMAEKITVRILTHRGHVLEGTIEHFDKYEIHLQLNGQTVIVYRRGLYEFSTEAEGQL